MARCLSKTASGRQCLNLAPPGQDHCVRHRDEISGGDAIASATLALLGNALFPGIGLAVGALGGPAVRRLLREDEVRRARVFVSFDFDRDRALKDFFLGQARLSDSPFDVIDHSLKEAEPQAQWENKARAAIAQCDQVIVILGEHTHQARGVLKEVAMARAACKPILQLIGYRDRACKRVAGAGRAYAWTWDNLNRLLN